MGTGNSEMIFGVLVWTSFPGVSDPAGQRVVMAAQELGFSGVRTCHVQRLYFLQGALTPAQVETLAHTVLADPVLESFACHSSTVPFIPAHPHQHIVDVVLLPGVTDPVAESLLRAARVLGITGAHQAATGKRYLLEGELEPSELEDLAVRVCCNPLIEHYTVDQPVTPAFTSVQGIDETVEVIALREANDTALEAISLERRLALNLEEMRAIQAYYRREGRDPTDVELEMLAQTWSEHCVHKTFKARILYDGPPPGAPPDAPCVRQVVDSLLHTYIRGATERVDKPWVRSAFVDNAGIVAFTEHLDLAFKVETHNHPSALEPFGGANTGMGGVIRDILGVSARPIANTDVLCFGPQDLPEDRLPTGTLHPRRVAAGVIHGIEDYGNKMGIPTVNGATFYHPRYTANPLVFCGCVGVLPRGSHPTEPRPDDLIVVVGGRTGRDGLRGATFSSMAMDETTGHVAGSAVQIGDPIQEKRVLDVLLQARDERLYNAITDCGAGGLSSAVGEMGRHIGARVHLERVLLKYPGLRPWEIWLSEAQERMVLAVSPEQWPRLRELCARHNVEAVSIGVFEPTGRLRLFYGHHCVGDLDMAFLHDGLPRRTLRARWPGAKPTRRRPRPAQLFAPEHALLALLAHPNIRSREEIVRRYDHEVQGGTAVKPLVGAANHGPGDAAVLVPLEVAESTSDGDPVPATILGVGLCPQYGELDPYIMAWAALDEAMRNVVAVGGDPDRTAVLDNFCWGNPALPDRLGALVRCAQGCYDAAVAYGVPFISGKDSLNNEYTDADGTRHAIPGTLLISALSIIPDARRTVTMDLKAPGNVLYVVGDTRAELASSHFVDVAGGRWPGDEKLPAPVPQARDRFRALHQAVRRGLVRACHDCAEGGLAVALAEMCLAGHLGADVRLDALPRSSGVTVDEVALFSESLTRFVVEVPAAQARDFETLMDTAEVPVGRLGTVAAHGRLRVWGLDGRLLFDLPVETLEQAWRGHTSTSLRTPSLAVPPNSAPFPHVTTRRRPRVLVLVAEGTNREREAALACELAGGAPEIVHVNQIVSGERRLHDYHMLLLPGGFSYGDNLGAGTLWALDVEQRLGEHMRRFVESGRPVLGICNGFQALVKAGLLPGKMWPPAGGERVVTLAPNASGQFECRWVWLAPNPSSPCIFTQGLEAPVYCPVAHGEGRFIVRPNVREVLRADGLIALTYITPDGSPVTYPHNPNGSELHVAGICNPAGNVLGLMPHPEDHIFPWQHPRWHRGERGFDGLRLFQNGLMYAHQV
ncbi:MAG: phosphoribosylformylglycinamidine synthase subunit PurL [Ardenticatenia bacterium]|nr:phosphoribosylformylglycinamidine synthase subunit PurL [Ardenticatenia bacterium]